MIIRILSSYSKGTFITADRRRFTVHGPRFTAHFLGLRLLFPFVTLILQIIINKSHLYVLA